MDLDEKAFNSLIAGLGGLLIFILLIALAVVVVQIIAMVKVYKKAGKGGWEAIIPYYNTWVLCEIASVKWWFFLLMSASTICGFLGLIVLAPLAVLVSIAATFACNYNIALKFGKDGVGYGIGLTLLPVVFYSILGFGDATYTDKKLSAYGPIAESKVEEAKETVKEKTNNTNKNTKFCKNCGAPLDDGKFCSNCGKEVR